MITQVGVLPVGIEVDGVVHSEFELRPQLVRDSVDALEDARTATNDSYFGLVMLSKQFVRLGSLKPEQITVELLLDVYDMDMKVLMEGAAALRERLKTFRGAGEESAKTAASTA